MAVLHSTAYGLNVSLELRRTAEDVEVWVHAPMYMRKLWKMSHSYSLDFTDAEILADHDITRVLSSHYKD